ncbi:hypothetical protein PROAA_3640007 [Candidatus Propionivibrio aalborgensis]|uniref:Uncharacterized protein n=1 Tax=Candidatus Propionivibrio aalborgensis TaxID=1860101 RepID=A0A1A8XYH8_9RHOO|nr:hypothetical protein PROAA_3640007 [Candidatus Propionivibrio aalborgensis]
MGSASRDHVAPVRLCPCCRRNHIKRAPVHSAPIEETRLFHAKQLIKAVVRSNITLKIAPFGRLDAPQAARHLVQLQGLPRIRKSA